MCGVCQRKKQLENQGQSNMKFSVDAFSAKGQMLSIAGRMVHDNGLQVIDEEAGSFWYAFFADDMGPERAMDSTLCGIIWTYGRTYMVNVGDSRLYRWRDGMLEQMSTDCKDGSPAIRDITAELAEDDIVVICSDGVYGAVPDEEIEYFLTVSAAPARDLCDRSEVNCGTGNASVALIKIGGGDFGCIDKPDDDGRWDCYA